jgi:ABC-type dipeptide/oligopeptide/nickel transport system permease subunit
MVQVPLLWHRHEVTLQSAMRPPEVRERLAKSLPRFAVPSGIAIPRFGLSTSRYYLGSLQEKEFVLHGPFGRKGFALSVHGTIHSQDDGTIIHLTVRPAGATLGLILIYASGVIASALFALLEHLVVFPLVLFLVFSLLGVGFFAIACRSAVRSLNELLQCLESLWNARR